MEQPIIDDMDEDSPRSAQMVYRSVEERFDAVQDEVKLLKAEIKQTLIDLREFMMKGRTISTTPVFDVTKAISSNGEVATPEDQNNPSIKGTPAAPSTAIPQPILAPASQNARGDDQGGHSMDAVKMGHIIGWLGTVANRGMSSRQLKPFLQTYEQSGHLTPAMATLTYKSLEELEAVQGGQFNQTCSPTEYSQCLLELHEIICNPGYSPPDAAPAPRSRRMTTPMQEPVSAPESFVQFTAPKAKAGKPRKQAKKAKASGRKRNQDQPVEPMVGASWDPIAENGHNG